MLLEKKKLDYLFRFSSFLLLISFLFDRVFDYPVVYLPKIAGVVVIVACILNIIYQYRFAKRGIKYTVDIIFSIGGIVLAMFLII